MGMKFSDYLRDCRMDKAKMLLETSSISVGRIAGMCGFRSAAYFIKVFAVKYGSTPGEYRRAFKLIHGHSPGIRQETYRSAK